MVYLSHKDTCVSKGIFKYIVHLWTLYANLNNIFQYKINVEYQST